MESGSELSKTVATFILQKILLDDSGLSYICQTYDRFSHVAIILGKMVISLAKEPSARLLKHVVRCYLRLTDNPRLVGFVSFFFLIFLVFGRGLYCFYCGGYLGHAKLCDNVFRINCAMPLLLNAFVRTNLRNIGCRYCWRISNRERLHRRILDKWAFLHSMRKLKKKENTNGALKGNCEEFYLNPLALT